MFRALGTNVPDAEVPAWLLRRNNSDRLAIQPRPHVLDHLAIKALVVFRRDVAEMRRDDDVVELAERMVGREWFLVVNVDAGAGDLLGAQRGLERLLLNDRPTRRIDQERVRLHQ